MASGDLNDNFIVAAAAPFFIFVIVRALPATTAAFCVPAFAFIAPARPATTVAFFGAAVFACITAPQPVAESALRIRTRLYWLAGAVYCAMLVQRVRLGGAFRLRRDDCRRCSDRSDT